MTDEKDGEGSKPGRALNMCPKCRDYTLKQCRALKSCDACDDNLEDRAARRERNTFQRATGFEAFPGEFDSSALVELIRPVGELVHRTPEFLAYVHGLVSVARAIDTFVQVDPPQSAVIGFRTGSDDVMWLYRERCDEMLADRIRLLRGLSHGENEDGANPTELLERALDNLWDEFGVRRLAIVDEVMSGGQMVAARNRVDNWCKKRKRTLQVLLLGLVGPDRKERQVYEKEAESMNSESKDLIESERSARSEQRERKARRKLTKGSPALQVQVSLHSVPLLLAADELGDAIKRAQRAGARYIPYRACPGSHRLACKGNVIGTCPPFHHPAPDGVGGAFSSTVRKVCKAPPKGGAPAKGWPNVSCPDCAELVQHIREEYSRITDPLKVQGGTALPLPVPGATSPKIII